MQVNFWKCYKKRFLKYKKRKKKQAIDIFLQIEAFLNSSKQSIFFIDIDVIAHVFPKKVARITKKRPWLRTLHIFRAGWVAF